MLRSSNKPRQFSQDGYNWLAADLYAERYGRKKTVVYKALKEGRLVGKQIDGKWYIKIAPQ